MLRVGVTDTLLTQSVAFPVGWAGVQRGPLAPGVRAGGGLEKQKSKCQKSLEATSFGISILFFYIEHCPSETYCRGCRRVMEISV